MVDPGLCNHIRSPLVYGYQDVSGSAFLNTPSSTLIDFLNYHFRINPMSSIKTDQRRASGYNTTLMFSPPMSRSQVDRSPAPRRASSRYSGQRLEPISEEITPADHHVFCQGGTSSNLERLQSRLQAAKRRSPELLTQIEDMAYEMSYLKAELQWHKESKQLFLKFRDTVLALVQEMEDSIEHTTMRLYECEQNYLGLWDDQSERI